MDLDFRPLILPTETETLAIWLSNEVWPFHSSSNVTKERVYELIEKGFYSEPNNRTFWIVAAKNNERLGLIRMFDLDDIGDGSPLFDLRILSKYRGQGIGKVAVTWLTKFLFDNWSELRRIEGTTRVDNLPMRNIFRKCGYVKEGHYRKSWPTHEGHWSDTVQYAILREDWISGKPTLVTWND